MRLLHLEFSFEGSKVICGIFASLGEEGVMVHPNFVKVFVQCMVSDVILLFVDALSVFGCFGGGICFGLLFEFSGTMGDSLADL